MLGIAGLDESIRVLFRHGPHAPSPEDPEYILISGFPCVPVMILRGPRQHSPPVQVANHRFPARNGRQDRDRLTSLSEPPREVKPADGLQRSLWPGTMAVIKGLTPSCHRWP